VHNDQSRRLPPPWSIEDIGGWFVVKASNGRPLVFIYYGEASSPAEFGKFIVEYTDKWSKVIRAANITVE
jgi:hypothetical protein